MMQSKRNDVEAESENELKSSNNEFGSDRQGKLNKSENTNKVFFVFFFSRKTPQLLDDSNSHNYCIFIHGWFLSV